MRKMNFGLVAAMAAMPAMVEAQAKNAGVGFIMRRNFFEDDVLGDDMLGGYEDYAVGDAVPAGAVAPAAMVLPVRNQAGGLVQVPPQQGWRRRLAPGVGVPGTMLYTMALDPDVNDGVFDATHSAIDFVGKPQKPFRGERVLAIVTRTAGVTAIPVGQLFVGVDLVQATAARIPVEAFAGNSFGVRMKMPQSEPGVEVRWTVGLRGPALAGADAISVAILVFGQTIA